ncbi:MAG: DUF1214 domain-containing protein [Acidimicrobiia bacterium]
MEHTADQVGRLRSGELFDDLVEAWRRLGRLVYGDATDPASLERATGLLYMTRYLSAGSILAMELGDPDYPYFERWADRSWSWGIDNPDGIYSFAAVRGDATYRIYGDRGTARQFDIQVHAPHFCEAPNYSIAANLNLDDLHVEADGSVEILVSPERHEGNWIETSAGIGSLCVRQFFYDWEAERPAKLVIERVGADYPPPPEDPAKIAARAEMLIRWLDDAGTFWDQMVKMCLDAGANASPFNTPDMSDWGGHRGLSYGLGAFTCEPDEAVILEVEPPDCLYWSFQLASPYWESLDYWRRQSSLNGHQAVLDGDGVFRCVIAHRDPGVHNWLDTAGFTRSALNGRWLHATTFPQPEMRVVPFDEVLHHLPSDSARVTPEARSEALRRRQAAAQNLRGF